MRILFSIISIFLYLSCAAQIRGELISSELISRISKNEIRLIYSALKISEVIHPIDFEVDLYKIEYWTPEPRGEFLTKASGLLYVPVTICNFPVVSYHHGTVTYGKEPSDLKDLSYLIPVPLATGGYVVSAADYVGYGSTPDSIPHAYLHAQSEATSAIDMLTASGHFGITQDIYFSTQLFLTGYSQGGHVTMAVNRELQEGDYNYTVTAAASGSGPYQLSEIARDSILTSSTFSSPTYTTFLLESYKYIYRLPDLYSQVYKSPYKESVPEIYDRQSPGNPITLPRPAFNYLAESFIDSVLNGTHQFNNFLEENDVVNWVPKTPVRLFYCTGDEQVPYTISIETAETMKQLGATDLDVIKVADNLSHSDCFYPTADLIKMWFDELKDECAIVGVNNNDNDKPQLFSPNVVDDYIILHSSMKKNEYQIFNLSGVEVLKGKINNDIIYLKSLQPGMYLMALNAEKHLFYKK